MYKNKRYIIGVDPGVNTGISVWDKTEKKFSYVGCVKIHMAMQIIMDWVSNRSALVRVEDARKRLWFGSSGREQLQGAGSIKRDCLIWEDYLKHIGADYEMVAPKNNKTKLDADKFRKITGWTERTNEHARDAGMLVYGF